jgi:hypothetical protein
MAYCYGRCIIWYQLFMGFVGVMGWDKHGGYARVRLVGLEESVDMAHAISLILSRPIACLRLSRHDLLGRDIQRTISSQAGVVDYEHHPTSQACRDTDLQSSLNQI